MRKVKLTALVLVGAALIFLFSGCAAEVRCGDPVGEYDKTTVVTSDEDGDLTVMKKTFGYDGESVELIRVENGTGSAYDISFIASFDVPWREKPMKIPKWIYGFPAHYSGYVLIRPGTDYDGCELKIGLSPTEEESPLKYLEFGTDCDLLVTAEYNFESLLFPDTDMIYNFDTLYENGSGRNIHLFYYYVVFDNSGQVIAISEKGGTTGIGKQNYITIRYGVPYDGEFDDYRLPDNLRGELHGVVAVESADYCDNGN